MSKIKKHIRWIFIFSILICQIGNASNNDSIPEFKNFKLSRIVLTGNGYTGFAFHLNNKQIDTTGMTPTSMTAGLMPIVLWKLTPRLFFEGEIEFMLEHGMVEVEIGYANLSYAIPDLERSRLGNSFHHLEFSQSDIIPTG